MRLTIREIMAACGGRLANAPKADDALLETTVSGVSTDSRQALDGCLFVPLAGPKFDGHQFIHKAAENGAVCVLSEKDGMANETTLPVIQVASTYRALLDLAAYYRNRLAANGLRVAAVTGSAGKTTTKDMMASVLSQRYPLRKTEGNLNNLIGLPLTVFKISESDQMAVLEMGMNHFGEIHELSLTARPDIAVITNIGDAHVENLGSREGIRQAKLEILDGLPANGTVVLNGDDPLLSGLTELRECFARVIFCHAEPSVERVSTAEAPAVYAKHIVPLGLSGARFTLCLHGDESVVHLPQPGNHMVMNALLAAATGYAAGLTMEEIVAGLEAFVPSRGRMVVTEIDGITVIDDAYNANPASMRAVADVLMGLPTPQGRRVCVLGDMFELGAQAEQLHEELGRYLAERGIDLLVTMGTLARFIHEGYTASVADRRGEARHFEDKTRFISEWRNILHEGDVVLVKASRGMAFEEIVAAMKTEGRSCNIR